MFKSNRLIFFTVLAIAATAILAASPACKPIESETEEPIPLPATNETPTANHTPAAAMVADAPTYVEVIVGRKEFNPAIITIPVGSTVAWVNMNDEPHMIISTDRVLNGNLPVGGTYSYTFKQQGTFFYFCDFWNEMGGTIHVNQG